MAIKAIAMDIDGTLTNDEKVITPRTRERLLQAQREGIRLLLASGRPAQGLKALAHELELDTHDGLLVCFNGACVIDAQTDEVLYEQPMPTDEVVRLIDHLRGVDVIPWITQGRKLYIEDAYRCMLTLRDGSRMNVVKYERDCCGMLVEEVADLADVARGMNVDKLLTSGDPAYLEANWEGMYEPFRDTLSGMFTADWYFEFNAPDINKSHALAGALPKLGIEAADVVAFGDGQNDRAMLEWAGTGVAMANAVDETKAAAQMVTLSNNEDGIAVALDRLLA